MRMHLDRRQALGLAVGLIASRANPSFAQSQSSYEQIGPYVKDGIAILDFVTGTQSSQLDVVRYVSIDYISRRRLVTAAKEFKIASNQQSARAFVDGISNAASPYFPEYYFNKDTFESQLRVIDEITKRDLPILPDIESVQPIGVPSIEPSGSKKSTTTDLLVIATIAFETIGITLEEGAVTALIEENPEFKAELDQALKYAINSDWKNLAKVSENAFKFLVSSKIGVKLSASTAKKLSFKLALRCVPIAGWIYVAASFVVAVMRNYHRFSFA